MESSLKCSDQKFREVNNAISMTFIANAEIDTRENEMLMQQRQKGSVCLNYRFVIFEINKIEGECTKSYVKRNLNRT